MPLQNRVQPTGDIISHATYGQFMGNRGILHDVSRHLTKARWRHKAWVTCLLEFKGRNRTVMRPGNYTELFFYDEAVAFAAGHRPCGECRRDDFNRFRATAEITGRIADYDKTLHSARAIPRVYGQRRYKADLASLPPGCFILSEQGLPQRVEKDYLLPFGPSGYGPAEPRPSSGIVTVLTPAPLVQVLRAGYSLAAPLAR